MNRLRHLPSRIARRLPSPSSISRFMIIAFPIAECITLSSQVDDMAQALDAFSAHSKVGYQTGTFRILADSARSNRQPETQLSAAQVIYSSYAAPVLRTAEDAWILAWSSDKVGKRRRLINVKQSMSHRECSESRSACSFESHKAHCIIAHPLISAVLGFVSHYLLWTPTLLSAIRLTFAAFDSSTSSSVRPPSGIRLSELRRQWK